jgi:hypothetical protein
MNMWKWIIEKIFGKALGPALILSTQKMPVMGQMYRHKSAQKMVPDLKGWNGSIAALANMTMVENPWSRPLLYTGVTVNERHAVVTCHFLAGEDEQCFNIFCGGYDDRAERFGSEFFHWFEDYMEAPS